MMLHVNEESSGIEALTRQIRHRIACEREGHANQCTSEGTLGNAADLSPPVDQTHPCPSQEGISCKPAHSQKGTWSGRRG